jgi:hypothetical protein
LNGWKELDIDALRSAGFGSVPIAPRGRDELDPLTDLIADAGEPFDDAVLCISIPLSCERGDAEVPVLWLLWKLDREP